MPPLTAQRALTTWVPHVAALVLAVVAAGVYLLLARRHRDWPRARTALFLAGIGAWLVTTCSVLGSYDHTLFWVLAVQDVLLLTVVPVPLVLSRPAELVLAPRRRRRVRVPVLVGSCAGVVGLLGVYATGLDTARLEHRALFVAVQVGLVALGTLFLGPLLAERGEAHGLRVLVAFVDSLLDALPGLVVLGAHGTIAAGWYVAHARAWGPSTTVDQQLGGTAMVALSEVVGLPTLLVLLVQWVRADAHDALMTDLVLDVEHGTPSAEPELQQPWWQQDAGPLAARASREGWSRPADDAVR